MTSVHSTLVHFTLLHLFTLKSTLSRPNRQQRHCIQQWSSTNNKLALHWGIHRWINRHRQICFVLQSHSLLHAQNMSTGCGAFWFFSHTASHCRPSASQNISQSASYFLTFLLLFNRLPGNYTTSLPTFPWNVLPPSSGWLSHVEEYTEIEGEMGQLHSMAARVRGSDW
jgi:hypothetical protein